LHEIKENVSKLELLLTVNGQAHILLKELSALKQKELQMRELFVLYHQHVIGIEIKAKCSVCPFTHVTSPSDFTMDMCNANASSEKVRKIYFAILSNITNYSTVVNWMLTQSKEVFFVRNIIKGLTCVKYFLVYLHEKIYVSQMSQHF
jgi:hypothetical protein